MTSKLSLLLGALLIGAAGICAPFIVTAADVTPSASGAQCTVDDSGACTVNGASCELVDNTCYSQDLSVSYGTPTYSSDLSANNAKIYGCSTTNTNIPSVGQLTATGGPYVPVTDAAVTKNTGYLVYKACVLDALAAQLKQAATAQITTQTVKLVNSNQNNNGKPLFVQNIGIDRAATENQNTTEFFNELNAARANDPNLVSSDIVNSVQASSSSQTPIYAATVSASDQQSFIQGTDTGGWSDWFRMTTNPNNNPVFQKANLQLALDTSNAQAAADRAQELNWGSGYYAPKTPVKVGDTTVQLITTPGAEVAQALGAAIGAGYNQLQSATDLDSLINSTYSGLAAQMLSNPTGLAGLSQPTANADGTSAGPSYLDSMFQSIINLIKTGSTSGTPAATGTATSTSAATALATAISSEQQYLGYRQQTMDYLNTEAALLSSTQDACWVNLETAVATLATSTSAQYTVATSTAYAASSTADIITPVKTLFQQDIDQSTSTIAALQLLLVGVSAANATDALNQSALNQLAVYTTDHVVHSAADIAAAQQGITDIQTAVGPKVDATIATWKQGTGWCNASSTAVVAAQLVAWEK